MKLYGSEDLERFCKAIPKQNDHSFINKRTVADRAETVLDPAPNLGRPRGRPWRTVADSVADRGDTAGLWRVWRTVVVRNSVETFGLIKIWASKIQHYNIWASEPLVSLTG